MLLTAGMCLFLGIYLTMVMVMTGFSIVISVIVLDLHHHEPTSPVPRWLRRLVFGCMARLLCIFTPFTSEHSSLFQIAHGRVRKEPGGCRENGTLDEEEHLESNNVDGLGLHHDSGGGGGGLPAGGDGMHTFVRGLYDELEAIMAPRKRKPLFEEILQHLRDITSKMRRNIRRDQVKEEWKMLAKIIDRFLLVMFLIAITALTISILYIYPSLATPADVFVINGS